MTNASFRQATLCPEPHLTDSSLTSCEDSDEDIGDGPVGNTNSLRELVVTFCDYWEGNQRLCNARHSRSPSPLDPHHPTAAFDPQHRIATQSSYPSSGIHLPIRARLPPSLPRRPPRLAVQPSRGAHWRRCDSDPRCVPSIQEFNTMLVESRRSVVEGRGVGC